MNRNQPSRLATSNAICALALAIAPAASQTPFCDQLRALTQDPTVAAAHWGVQVTDLHGTPLCSVNEAQLFRPASNNKIFTTATALALLGPTHTITTRLEAEGEIGGSTLRGNLLLIGAGDANFGSHNIPYVAPVDRPKSTPPEPPTIADIEAFADQVVAQGIRAIEGDIVGDDTYFAWQPYPPDWDIDDMVFGYGAPISALTVHDNAIDITVTPHSPPPSGSSKATVTLIPSVPYYQLDANVQSVTVTPYSTTPSGSAKVTGSPVPVPYYQLNAGLNSIAINGGCDDRLSYQRTVGAKLLKVTGDLASGAPPCHQAIAIQDPAEYTALALKLALERRGVKVTGTATARHYERGFLGAVHVGPPGQDVFLSMLLASPPAPPVECEVQVTREIGEPPPAPRTLLTTHVSPTLLEDVTYTNKVSQNQHAELLLRTLGAAYTCERDGLRVIRAYLLHAGVGLSDIALYDGSGLSTHDLVTPRALARFLAFAATQPWFPQWKATLPIGGVDGGLAARFTSPATKGRVFAKTGTLGESRALSGYLTAASGQTLIFSILVDTHLPGTTADRTIMDRIVEVIAAQN